jgi:hypothetical protein
VIPDGLQRNGSQRFTAELPKLNVAGSSPVTRFLVQNRRSLKIKREVDLSSAGQACIRIIRG